MVQIDVLKVEDNNVAVCNLYTDNRCVKIFMSAVDYEAFISDGFFIRSGKEMDSANVLNTTGVYERYEKDASYKRKI